MRSRKKQPGTCRHAHCGCCGDHVDAPRTLEEVVASYRSHETKNAERERDFYAALPLRDAIHAAAFAMTSEGRRHSHQRRMTRAAMREAERRFLANVPRLQRCRTFHELFLIVRELIADIFGLGELYCYDASLRIGAALGLEPEYVYLHCGTRHGARMLGLNYREPWLAVSEIPEPLQVLSARELEDILCIYADVFG
jgi:hypothetical protein